MQILHSGALVLTGQSAPLLCPQSGRARKRMLQFFVPAIGVLAFGVSAWSSPGLAQYHGDGSGTSNPALRGSAVPTKCLYAWQCPDPEYSQTAPQPTNTAHQSPSPQPADAINRDVDCDALVPGASTPEHCAIELADMALPQSYEAAPQTPVPLSQEHVAETTPAPIDYARNAPREAQRPLAFEPDWNIGLRSGFENSATGSQFVISVLPSFSLRRGHARGEVTFAGESVISLEQNNGVRIANGNVSVDANYAFGRNTSLIGGASISASQDSVFSSGISSGISAQPIIVTGSGSALIAHQFGRIGLEARGSVERQVYSATQMQVGPDVNNSSLSRFGFGGGLRASIDVSRTTSLFVDGAISRNIYDAVSTTAGAKLDNWTYGLRGGMTMNIGRTIEAELAGGYGLRQFDSASLAATPAWLASAQFTVRPEQRLSFIGTVSTEFAIAESGTATSQIDYVASIAAQYQVNSQLGLRGNVGGAWRDVIGATDGWEVAAGVGADYAINAQTALTADYNFTTGQTDGAAVEQNHQISLGVRYGRNSLSVSNQ